MRLVLFVLLAGLAGCPASHVDTAALVAASIAPRPFTSDEIRAAMPVGERLRFRIVMAGKPPTEEEWTVTAANADGCTIRSMTYDPNGTLLEDQGEATSKWTELEAHATFPARSTQRSEGEIEVPAGRYPAWLYTVTEPGANGDMEVRSYAFAKTLPGPPVRFTVRHKDDEVFSMTLLSRAH
jgi:hypothetical protein